MFIAFLALAISLNLVWPAQADHYTCHWRPGNESPKKYGYKHYCNAEQNIVDPVKSTLQWSCTSKYNRTVSPANWNMVGHLALEFATPCGEGGWFLDTYGICPGDYFAMCLKPAQDCYYLHDEDDCQWPDLYNVNELPKTLDIWYWSDEI
ncbi:hypothetical protein BDZ90DRAFT_233243 [Jaminaea rosea]|uniref:Uncharacterized protein n=1 Tax=Jaminaea rosea TaxID=1569628 RepID=A0A316UQP7_9BASI|nr:hypothetical protein BDZ90DRAFT_233243 [Jaminaea rosea]PWN26631.1 hypothetical protein BDZ90DRAFT_233243 [Jaminaea rosea]